MVRQTTSPDQPTLSPILNAQDLLTVRRLVREVAVSSNVISYAVRLCAATRPGSEGASGKVNEMVKWGAGSRASQALIMAGKARALLQGRRNVACEDVRALMLPVLRHRVITNFKAEAEGISVSKLIEEIAQEVKE